MVHTRHILATAGHVDHGKTTLIRQLTRIETDRLPQEKSRGMTIDLGFAHVDLAPPSDESGSTTCHLGIIDVPGHEDFVKNMIAGVGSIDLALLVVAANEGAMPQTEEHVQILSYLGVARGVVALTKIDLVADAVAAIARVRASLSDSVFADAPIVPTSAISESGLDELRAAMFEAASNAPAPADRGKPRLPIDRAFTVRGAGTVVTGTLTGGTLDRGQVVTLQPQGKAVRIRAIQSHGRTMDAATPGSRVALNLPGLEAGPGHHAIRRGDVIVAGETAAATAVLEVQLWRLPQPSVGAGAAAIPRRVHAWVHHGTACRPGRLQLLDVPSLGPGETALARLHLGKPIHAMIGDRFIVRDAAQRRTLAGGVILEMLTAPPRRLDPRRRAMLRRRAEAPMGAANQLRSALAGDDAVSLPSLLQGSSLADAELLAAADMMVLRSEAMRVKSWLVEAKAWCSWLEEAGRAVDEEHVSHPERVGLDLSRLRERLEPLMPASLVEGLLDALVERGFTRRGAVIARVDHCPALPPRLAEAGDRVRRGLSQRPLAPPSRRDLLPDDASHQALQFLLMGGEVVELSQDVVVLADAVDDATRRIRQHLLRHGGATASELKTAVGSTRRVIIPLLERLDREGVTRREGNLRRLAETAADPAPAAPGSHPLFALQSGDGHPSRPAPDGASRDRSAGGGGEAHHRRVNPAGSPRLRARSAPSAGRPGCPGTGG